MNNEVSFLAKDDLREKLLVLLKLSSSGTDRGLKAFCDSGYCLLPILAATYLPSGTGRFW